MSDEYPSFDDYEREAEEQLCGQPTMTASHRKAATMSDDRVELAALALCHSGKFACDGRCAPICFEFMGHKPKRCSHAVHVHGDLARDILNTLDPSIESLQAEVEDLGSCELCDKPLRLGQFVNQYDDVGTAHTNCKRPFAKPVEPTPAPGDDGSTMPTYVLLGQPALLETINATNTTRTQLDELRAVSNPAIEGDPVCKVISYDHAHEAAAEMGYPSLTEALEHLDELRAENGRLRTALQNAADAMTCRENDAHYCPNCDNSLYGARDEARKALGGTNAG